MRLKSRKKLIALLVVMVMSLLLVNGKVYAKDNVVDSPTGKVDSLLNEEETEVKKSGKSQEKVEEEEKTTESEMLSVSVDTLPKVSLDDVKEKVSTKGEEITEVVQLFGLYAVVVLFIIAIIVCALSHIGIVPKGAGVWSIVICLIAFVLIFVAPEFLAGFTSWILN